MSAPTHTPALTPPHRLQTISLTQALSQQSSQHTRISTGSHALDSHLHGGLPRGQVCEIIGPPGSGKTRFLLSVLGQFLSSHGTPPPAAVWISCATTPRLPEAAGAGVRHFSAPTLAHLLALLPRAAAAAAATAAAVDGASVGCVLVDDVSEPFTTAFPPGLSSEAKRRPAMMAAVMAELARIAATRGAVVALAVQMGTRVVSGVGGVLQSSLGAPQWTGAVATRLVVLRTRDGGREVRVLKMDGREAGEDGLASARVSVGEHGWADVDGWQQLEEDGFEALREAELQQSRRRKVSLQLTPKKKAPLPPPASVSASASTSTSASAPAPAPAPAPALAPLASTGKRKRAETGIAAGVIPDSEDEDLEDGLGEEEFGWGDDGMFEIGEKGVEEEGEGEQGERADGAAEAEGSETAADSDGNTADGGEVVDTRNDGAT